MTTPTVCPRSRILVEPPPEIAATLAVIGGKWKMLTLWQLLRRPCRFNELRRAIPGVSQHMLTATLRDLETHGVLTRTVFAEVPPRVEYALTDHGETLAHVMKALGDWGLRHLQRTDVPADAAARHRSVVPASCEAAPTANPRPRDPVRISGGD